MHSYTSDRVFEGVRILTEKQRQEHLERLKRALDKLNRNGKQLSQAKAPASGAGDRRFESSLPDQFIEILLMRMVAHYPWG